jgi:hypothetical protein
VTLSVLYKFMNNQLIDVPVSWFEVSKDYKCTNLHINKEAQGKRKIINLIDFLSSSNLGTRQGQQWRYWGLLSRCCSQIFP